MPIATATKVSLYRYTLGLVRALYSNSTFRESFRRALSAGKKNYLGIPLGNHIWVLSKIDYNYRGLLQEYKGFLRGEVKPEEFAENFFDSLKRFYENRLARESLEQEVEKYEAGEIEHPSFATAEEHGELLNAESLPSEGARVGAMENFTQTRIPQLQALVIPHVPVQGPANVHLPGEVTDVTPDHYLEGGPTLGVPAEAEQKAVVPEQPFTPQSPPVIPAKAGIPIKDSGVVAAAPPQNDRRPAGLRIPSLRSLKLPRLPQGLTLPIGKFIRRNVTLTRVASLFTGALGAFLGGTVGGTPLAAAGGGIIGGSLPILVQQQGFSTFSLNLVSKVGHGGADFIGGISSGGRNLRAGVSRIGSSLSRTTGGPGRKVAFALLGFFLLSFFAVTGFAPPTATPPGGTPIAGGGGTCPDQTTIDQNKRDQNSCRYFGLGVNLFDTNIPPTAVDTYRNKYNGIFISHGGTIEEFNRRLNYIITNSKAVGLNPILLMGYWKTENNFPVGDGLRDMGCARDSVNFDEQVDCALGINAYSNPVKNPVANCAKSKDVNSDACRALKRNRSQLDINNPIHYPISTFDDFAEAHGSRDPNLNGLGTVNNNCISTYNKLVEVAEELNSCKVSAPAPITGGGSSSGAVVSCPFSRDGSGSFNITCGTARNLASNGCGHGVPPIYPRCVVGVYESCPGGDFTPQLKAAIDVRPAGSNGNNSAVYLSYINGRPANWTRVLGPIPLHGFNNEYWGERIEYAAIAEDGRQIRIDLTHVDRSSLNNAARNSGDQVGVILTNLDGSGSHLHIAVSVNGTWLDSISEAHICTP